MMEKQWSLRESVAALVAGRVTSRELVMRSLARIEECDAAVGAFLLVDTEGALRAAAESDRRWTEGLPLSPLDGIPFAVKDNFCAKGLKTTCASRFLEDYVSPHDATAVSLLKGAGCVLMGKLNMDEFAMGSSTRSSALGLTRNPWDVSRVPGGSSGGSAAAVAAGEVPFALGTDTGGSVRQPASFCGVVGLKPTYGVISRYGVASFASSMDAVGVVTPSVEDAALVLECLAVRDPLDATSRSHPAPQFIRDTDQGVEGLRIGVLSEFAEAACSPRVQALLRQGIDQLVLAGAEARGASLPRPDQALLCYCALSAVEAASNLARYDGVRYGRTANGSTPMERASNSRGKYFGHEVKSRILLGTALLTDDMRESHYRPARHIREQVSEAFRALFASYDLIIGPTTPTGAFGMDERLTDLQMREMDLCTVYANLAGLPAITVPAGLDENGMPLGLQLIAPSFREELLFRGGRVLENALWRKGEGHARGL
ncbi:MAG: Asp-tRNA(Asn)/Glu-tRNA(Gln) amidotransferase subunit GatA [Ruminococcaceae bacterium]|nr:Asp-tRNA(Asn)/Glu-tRNA(Gln) amidotransferase subunit GatA [Oscillospiraceae bacterium]